MSFWVVMILAGVVAGLAGLIIGWPTLRLRGDYLAIVTLGFGEIIPDIFRNGDQMPLPEGVQEAFPSSSSAPTTSRTESWSHAARSPWVRRDAG